ncbi:MAG: sigma-70 family RNA polymerase sigma factor [Phaeodactylibacter sp.]|nr:sigma-70 family RNA polymerase sigma factor [Phaeodactylibacter sp.]
MSSLEFCHQFMSMETMLRAFAHSLTKDQDEATDLFQDTAYKAFKYRERFQPTTNFQAWVFTIMKNTFINKYRQKKRRQVLNDQTPGNYFINTGASVDNEGESSITLKEIGRAIDQLDANLAVPFKLALQGYQYDEIAEQLKIPLGTVKSRIHFARKQLQYQLRKWYQMNYFQEIL